MIKNSETYMLLMDYLSIRGEEIPYHAKKGHMELFSAYIDAHSQISIDECPGDGVQAIPILQSQCSNIIFSGQSKYNRLFHKVIHKGGKLEINYIKIFQNDKAW